MKTRTLFALALFAIAANAQAAAPRPYNYVCESRPDGAEMVILVVNPNGDDEQILINGASARFDSSYTAREFRRGLRFLPTQRSIPGFNGDDYTNEFIIDPSLQRGAATGKLMNYARGEGFFSTVFQCKLDR